MPTLKNPGNLWRYVFVVFVVILLYQFKSTWDDNTSFEKTNQNIPTDSVAFLTIEEHHYGTNRGFDSLMESLYAWEHDKKDKSVQLKFEAFLPKEKSKVMLVYDKTYTTFEKYVDMVSISTFPYEYRFKEKPLVEVHHVDAEGNLFFTFKGKKIQLKPGQSYQSFGMDDFRLYRTKIVNNGFYKKKDFTLFEAEKQS